MKNFESYLGLMVWGKKTDGIGHMVWQPDIVFFLMSEVMLGKHCVITLTCEPVMGFCLNLV